MIPTFKNLLKAQSYFHNEQVCREHLEEIRWNGRPVCPYCAIDKAPYRLSCGRKFRCSDKDCRRTFTVTIGTIFESSKIPLQKWFLGIWLASAHKKGISSLQLSRDLGITQKSSWFLLHRIREMLGENAPVILKGTVEVDAVFIGGKEHFKHQTPHARSKRLAKIGKDSDAKFGRGNSASETKTVVFGLLQRDGKVVNHVVPAEKAEYILPIIQKQIEVGSNMVSDQLSAYRKVTKLGYTHESVDHAAREYVRGNVHTGTIDGYWGLLRRGITGIYHNVSPKHLHRYCDEFSYRYNTRKKKDADRFNDSIEQASGKRLTYKRLVNKSGNSNAILK